MSKEVVITKEELKRLYCDEKLSANKIASQYSCVPTTIRVRLRKEGIKIRPNKIVNISKEILKRMYIDEKKGTYEIGRILKLDSTTVKCHLKKFNIRVRSKSEALLLLKNINITKEELKDLYLDKRLSTVKIGEMFKCNNGVVANRLKKYEIPIRHDRSGENHPNWLGGSSFEPYLPIFNKKLKSYIRDRDNHICQLCGALEIESDRVLTIHHIDYIKKNCNETNLISLCSGCNGRVNVNRLHWQEYFTNLIRNKYLQVKENKENARKSKVVI